MGDRLINKWGDKVEIPVSPNGNKNNEDRKEECFKVQKEIKKMIGVR